MTGGQWAGMGAWLVGFAVAAALMTTAREPSHAQRDMQSCEAMCGGSEYVESFRYELPTGLVLHVGDGAPVCICIPNCRPADDVDTGAADGGAK